MPENIFFEFFSRLLIKMNESGVAGHRCKYNNNNIDGLALA